MTEPSNTYRCSHCGNTFVNPTPPPPEWVAPDIPLYCGRRECVAAYYADFEALRTAREDGGTSR